MYSDRQFADAICSIVDPKDVHTGAQIIQLVEEKFTSTNTGSPKLPTLEECQSHFASRQYDMHVTGDEYHAIEVTHDYICRQLRAGA